MPEVTDEFIDRIARLEELANGVTPLLERVGTLEKKVNSLRVLVAIMVRTLLAEDLGVVAYCEKILRSWERNNKGLRTIVTKLVERVRAGKKVSYKDDVK